MARSRNVVGAREPGHPASGKPYPPGFVMAPVQVPATILPMISHGCQSAKVREFAFRETFWIIASFSTVFGIWHCPLQLLIRLAVDYKYVDETADIARHYSVDSGCIVSSPVASERHRSEVSNNQRALTEPSIINDTVESHSSDHYLPPHRPDGSSLTGYSPYPLQLSPGNQSSISTASPNFSYSSHASPGSRDLFNHMENGLPNLDEHEACLMRYFVVQLAPWVGTPMLVEWRFH